MKQTVLLLQWRPFHKSPSDTFSAWLLCILKKSSRTFVRFSKIQIYQKTNWVSQPVLKLVSELRGLDRLTSSVTLKGQDQVDDSGLSKNYVISGWPPPLPPINDVIFGRSLMWPCCYDKTHIRILCGPIMRNWFTFRVIFRQPKKCCVKLWWLMNVERRKIC